MAILRILSKQRVGVAYRSESWQKFLSIKQAALRLMIMIFFGLAHPNA